MKSRFTTCEEFPDFASFLHRVTTGERKPVGDDDNCSSNATNRAFSWTLGADWNETLRLAKEGWPEGAARVAERSIKLSSRITKATVAPVPQYDVWGDTVDVGRYCEGVPECMIRFEEIESKNPGKVIRVLVNLGMSSQATAEQAEERGAVAIALCNALEHAGRTVEVLAGSLSSSKNDGSGITCARLMTIKRAGESIETDRIAFMLAHPAVHRCFMFALLEMQSATHRKAFDSYGYSQTFRAEDADCDITIPREVRDLGEDWILARLREQGVEISD